MINMFHPCSCRAHSSRQDQTEDVFLLRGVEGLLEKYRTSGRARTKTRSKKKNKVVGLKVRYCVGAVFD